MPSNFSMYTLLQVLGMSVGIEEDKETLWDVKRSSVYCG